MNVDARKEAGPGRQHHLSAKQAAGIVAGRIRLEGIVDSDRMGRHGRHVDPAQRRISGIAGPEAATLHAERFLRRELDRLGHFPAIVGAAVLDMGQPVAADLHLVVADLSSTVAVVAELQHQLRVFALRDQPILPTAVVVAFRGQATRVRAIGRFVGKPERDFGDKQGNAGPRLASRLQRGEPAACPSLADFGFCLAHIHAMSGLPPDNQSQTDKRRQEPPIERDRSGSSLRHSRGTLAQYTSAAATAALPTYRRLH